MECKLASPRILGRIYTSMSTVYTSDSPQVGMAIAMRFKLILTEKDIEFGEDRVCLPVSEDICL